MGTDGNAVDAAAGTPLEVDAVTVVTMDVGAVVVSFHVEDSRRHDTANLNKSR